MEYPIDATLMIVYHKKTKHLMLVNNSIINKFVVLIYCFCLFLIFFIFTHTHTHTHTCVCVKKIAIFDKKECSVSVLEHNIYLNMV